MIHSVHIFAINISSILRQSKEFVILNQNQGVAIFYGESKSCVLSCGNKSVFVDFKIAKFNIRVQ